MDAKNVDLRRFQSDEREFWRKYFEEIRFDSKSLRGSCGSTRLRRERDPDKTKSITVSYQISKFVF
jgi:hypothetical protein